MKTVCAIGFTAVIGGLIGCSSTPEVQEYHTHFHYLLEDDGTYRAVPSSSGAVIPAVLQDAVREPSTAANQAPANMRWTPYGYVPDNYKVAPPEEGAFYPHPYGPYGPYVFPDHPHYPVAARWPYVVHNIHTHFHHLVPTPPLEGERMGEEHMGGVRRR